MAVFEVTAVVRESLILSTNQTIGKTSAVPISGGGAVSVDSLNQHPFRNISRGAIPGVLPCQGKSVWGLWPYDSGGGHDVDAYVSETMITKRSIGQSEQQCGCQ